MPDFLDALNDRYRDWLIQQKTNWPQYPQSPYATGRAGASPKATRQALGIADELTQAATSAAAGLFLGGAPGAALGAILPSVAKRSKAVEDIMMGLPMHLAVVPPAVKGTRRAAVGRRGEFIEANLKNKPQVFENLKAEARVNPAALPENARIHQLINARDSVFHATDVEGFRGILASGEIMPDLWIPIHAPAKPKKYEFDPIKGVSVSRVPRISPKASKAITFVIDRKKMPKSRPFAEAGYQKTGAFDLPPDAPRSIPNPRFEFENRTYNEPISLEAVKGILVDESALREGPHPSWSQWDSLTYDKMIEMGDHKAAKAFAEAKKKQLDPLTQIKELATQHNIPLKILPSGRAQHSYRATFGKLPPSDLFSPIAGVGLLELVRQHLDEDRRAEVVPTR